MAGVEYAGTVSNTAKTWFTGVWHIPLAPFRPLLWAVLPSAASCDTQSVIFFLHQCTIVRAQTHQQRFLAESTHTSECNLRTEWALILHVESRKRIPADVYNVVVPKTQPAEHNGRQMLDPHLVRRARALRQEIAIGLGVCSTRLRYSKGERLLLILWIWHLSIGLMLVQSSDVSAIFSKRQVHNSKLITLVMSPILCSEPLIVNWCFTHLSPWSHSWKNRSFPWNTMWTFCLDTNTSDNDRLTI